MDLSGGGAKFTDRFLSSKEIPVVHVVTTIALAKA
jgi:hypothetical protein